MAQMEHPKIAEVLAAISDDASLELFKVVALADINSYDLKGKMKLTRKQYYSRLFRLTRSGLIRRKDNLYSLTTFGKIFYDAETTIENALNNFWRMKAIDSLEIADGIPPEEHQKLIETLIKDQGIKTILSK
ncbi:MAG: putative transcriptional regulator [Candidatus Nitrosomirales archaeon]|jgi:predicted transcriptional regulator